MRDKPVLLASACLLGVRCRYDGGGTRLDALARLMPVCHIVPVCPEQLGGLPTPRTPSERVGARVLAKDGADVTDAFRRGADAACHLARLYGARLALMKARSPSCGAGTIYDGSFSGRVAPGDGVTGEALKAMGVDVYTEDDLDALLARLSKENEI